MADVLPGYTWDRRVARYRDTARGQFVGRTRIVNLLERQVSRAEDRLGRIVEGVISKEIAPGYAQVLMRDEMRRTTLQNIALAKGGFDRLSLSDYGKAGRQLRDTYQRITNLVRDAHAERVTLAQAMNRVRGYAGEARILYFETEKEVRRQAATQRAVVLLMIRDLGAAEHCEDCVGYYRQGYQLDLPPPGVGSVCRGRCRCGLRYREVEAGKAAELIGRRS